MLDGWHADPGVAILAVAGIALYVAGVRAFARQRAKRWPRLRILAFFAGVTSVVVALESPLDAAADSHFTPHMVQHLILTDLSAPLMLLGGPLLLLLGAAPHRAARRVVRVMRAPAVHAVAHPIVSWTLFIVTLWAIHFSGFFEAALENEPLHQLEHAVYLSTALLFWLPVIAIGPTPWVDGPLAFPIRMVYLLVAMPAEGFLGFAIYGSRRILYAHYAGAGLADQQTAGELMWIGSGLAMFVAFMAVGFEWAQHEERRSLREETRRVRDASFA